MNIFALDNDPRLAAIWQHDRHVVKMTLETAQLLSTAVWHNEAIRQHWTSVHGPFRDGIDNVDSGSVRLYKSISNPGHGAAIWSRANFPNFVWTFLHGYALVGEFHRRFQKRHACYSVFASFMPVIERIVGIDRMQVTERTEIAPGKWLKTVTIHPAVYDFAAGHDPFSVTIQPQYRDACIVPGDPIASYRNFYLEVKIFQEHVKWTRCEALPQFIRMRAAELTFAPDRVITRILELMEAHARAGTVRPTLAPSQPHPDTLKPTNPKALTRFGASR